jgi:hypothetical protein
MNQTMRCPRCSGRLRVEREANHEKEWACLSCGHREPYEPDEPESQEEAATMEQKPVDWRQAMLADLNAAIALVQRAYEAKAKAEQLHKAASDLGLDVDQLPWTSAASRPNLRVPWTAEEDASLLAAANGPTGRASWGAVAAWAKANGRAETAAQTRLNNLRALHAARTS